jgi:hypothetical protein
MVVFFFLNVNPIDLDKINKILSKLLLLFFLI